MSETNGGDRSARDFASDPWRILIAPDSFKGSLSSEEAAAAIAKGILRVTPSAILDRLPVADGGEGTTDALLAATGGERRAARVTGPLGAPVDSFYGLLSDGETAVVEAAAACGLTQIPASARDPRIATSRGLGELMIAALDSKPRRLVVGIGGSATNDGGSGLLRAFGARFLDDSGDDLPEGGAALKRLAKIDLSSARWPEEIEIRVASDVTNPLCGDNGASAVYGPQKGATPEMIPILDAALSRFAQVAAKTLGCDLSETPGAGAAGGIGFALTAFLEAKLRSGVDLVLETTNFHERAKRSDIIVTGEGRLDSQTGQGKTVMGIARAARSAGKPAVAFAGEVCGDLEALEREGLLAVASIASGPSSLEEMMASAGNLLENAAERMMKWLLLGVRMS